MSVILGPGGNVLLGPGGHVATDPDCCCGGTPPDCPCIYSLMEGPCCPDETLTGCTDELFVDSDCPSPTTPPFCVGSGVDYFTTRFRTKTVVNTACGGDLTGSCTLVIRINDDCTPEVISCSGSIRNGLGVCAEGCDVDCPGCNESGTIPNTSQRTTYSEPCIFQSGACCVFGTGCSQTTVIQCDILGGLFYGAGTLCGDVFCE